MKNVKIHIPVARYGYVEAEGTLKELLNLHNEIADEPLAMNNGAYTKIKSITGETILYNDAIHQYKDEEGNQLVGGSTFASEFKKPFPRKKILAAMVKKHKCKESDISAQWDMSGEIARNYGTAMHAALEYHFTYRDNLWYNPPKHPRLKQMISTLKIAKTKNKVISEALVSNIRRRMCGQIDLMELTGNKKCVIHDWKFSGDISKDLYSYEIQINYYRKILEFAGWEVEGMHIWNHNGKWTEYETDIINIANL